MAAESVDGGVKSGEARESRHFIVPSVQCDKVIHFFARLPNGVGHSGRAAGQIAHGAHVTE